MAWDILGEEGFHFFGTMSASISHEIKNVLAIINENAGLLEDFSLLAQRGIPLDPQRLLGVSRAICTQVKRADRITQNMKRFAQSTDHTLAGVPLADMLILALGLSARFAEMRGITLELITVADPMRITTNPFFLQNLLWRCLDFAMDVAGPDKTVCLEALGEDEKRLIRFSGLKDLEEKKREFLSYKRGKALLAALQGDIKFHDESGRFDLVLPKDIEKYEVSHERDSSALDR